MKLTDRKGPPPEGAFAIVVVLTLIALLTLLIFAILSLSTDELRGARIYSDGLTARQYYETGVNFTISQLRLGTQQDEEASGRELWASQPGAIRRFYEDGGFDRAYKLYSDDEMVVRDESELIHDLAPQEWNDPENDIHFVDLNKPIVRRNELDPLQPERITFPIVDPRALKARVHGFDIDKDAPINGVVVEGDDTELRAPMPVRWLYILADGTVGNLNEEGRFVGPAQATRMNPIVGRVAFWADDESCKININTATEPTPWDTPRAISKDDMDYGKYQPANHEFQRYPGHPATTALSTVIFPDGRFGVSEKEMLYGVLPRVVAGGTRSGVSRPGHWLTPDSDRLYATVDEFLFYPNRLQQSLITPDELRSRRFFLTATSRAPELNPRGQPKVAIWPLGYGNYPRTAYDHLAAFCATIGDELYAFQRANQNHATHDWDEIERNREVYEYLERELAKSVPGFGGNFEDKFGADYQQLLAQIFDYIRCTNLHEKARAEGQRRPRYFSNNGQVTPLQIDDEDVMGFGRYFTMTEFGLHFICNGHEDRGHQPGDGDGGPLEDNERWIQAAFLMEPFSASHGWPRLYNDFTVKVRGLDTFRFDNQPMEFPKEAQRRPGNLGGSWHGRNWGGPMGVRTFIGNSGDRYQFLSQRVRVKGDEAKSFSGGSVVVEIYQGNSTDSQNLVQTINLDFPAGRFPVPDLVEEGTTGFRGGGGTPPQYWWSFQRYRNTTRVPHAPGPEYPDPLRQWPPDRGGNRPGFKIGGVFRAEDVVRTLVPADGDPRLIAGRRVVPSHLFAPGAKYSNTQTKIDHLFNDTQGTHLLYGFGNEPGLTSTQTDGTQLTDAEYHYSRLPDVPPDTGKKNKWGDFDNGVAQIHDGGYINRPDEGNVASKGQYAYFAWNYREPHPIYFSPNRMIPSPGMFGSLPTGVKREQPWQTLLFRPQEDHPGEDPPPDHVLMNYFWMPVIEPYAISEPFSTAGRINLNYQMLPFTYIERATGIHAVMASERPLAVPNEYSKAYKLWDHETSDHPWLPNTPRGNKDEKVRRQWVALSRGDVRIRKQIDFTETLQQFEEKFAEGEIFKYPSEISTIHLVRSGETLSQYQDGSFWDNHLVTGDNTRERPYTNILPRVTTQSNSYRVYVWAEALRKGRESEPDFFDRDIDSVVSRMRGSTLIERYIDPNDPDIPDFTESANASRTLDEFFQFRILETKRFSS